ncbi:uncharacterized protein LOC122659161 [Telopea speciosissima]|uniref:uncharacterized protein LOC122659161 n=1 Tax=Telopea speciosissima TaxID=54955 RepID=UPI001CC735A7|nr:uncharacterized protein LOC122659161 [Telopea speciosissima]
MSKEILLNSSDNYLGVLGILREALQIFPRNGKIMASIALFSLVSNCLLFLGSHVLIEPFLLDLVTAMKKDVGVLLLNELIIGVAMWVVFLFSMIATVYASAVIYSSEKMTLKELLTHIGRTWRGPAITWFYISLMSLGCTFLVLIMFGLLTVVYNVMNNFALTTPALLVVLLVIAINLYFGMVWMVGLVVSVLEDACYGMEALRKAGKLMVGRKLQGYVVTLVLGLVFISISGFLGYATSHTKFSAMGILALNFMSTNIICLWKIYGAMVYTVLYFECKKIHGEEMKVELGSGHRMFSTVVPRFTASMV